jgi:hypothetical protein
MMILRAGIVRRVFVVVAGLLALLPGCAAHSPPARHPDVWIDASATAGEEPQMAEDEP